MFIFTLDIKRYTYISELPIVTMSCKPRQLNKFLSFAAVSAGGLFSFAAICTIRAEESFYSEFLMPIVTKFIDPELAHETAIFLTKHKLLRCRNNLTNQQESLLKTRVFNLDFTNPIGIAAGFDKNSQAVAGLIHYGVGFAEIGTVTPKPQEGNSKKRIFRATEDRALINRCGFNNLGIEYVKQNLSKYETFKPMLVGLNLGKNKDTQNLSSDYLIGLQSSKDIKSVNYLVINISSPNTPGLRDSQSKKNLENLLDTVLGQMHELSIDKPLLLKIAPDVSIAEIKDIADVIMKKNKNGKKVSGFILTNTTISRPSHPSQLQTNEKSVGKFYAESGGLSGIPVRDMSTNVIREFYKQTGGKVPIIGVGGVFSGIDAYDKIKAGASLVQLYTSLTFEGPPIVNKIKRELSELLSNDGFSSVSQAVGLDHRVGHKV